MTLRQRIKAAPGQRLSRSDLRRKVHQQLHLAGWIVYLLGAARWHDDGDAITAVFRWWHPLSWLLVLICIVPCAVMGERIGDAIPFRLSRHFRENPERLQWL